MAKDLVGGSGGGGWGAGGSTASEEGLMEADEWEEGLAETHARLLLLQRRPLFAKVLYIVGRIWYIVEYSILSNIVYCLI